MRPFFPVLLLSSLISLSAVNAEDSTDFPADNRIKIFTYTPSDVYTIMTKYGYQTSVSFAPNEEIEMISVGDRSMWQIIPAANRIFIRPMDDGLTTNMTVITNMREYTFDIKSVSGDKKDNLYVIQFRYPNPSDMLRADDNIPAPVAFTSTVSSRSSSVAIPPLDTQRDQTINEQYTYTGPDAVAPIRVYDDGKYTYVEYDQIPVPAPRPQVTGPSGNKAVAKHTLRNNTLVIHTVASRFVLASESGDITVYNELFHN